jgi:GNAT superfamily N-acetyltransferase
MTIELVEASREHLDEISKIAYDAFQKLSERHGFPPDFPNSQSARPVFELLVQRSDYFGLVALVDKKPVGSNFVLKSDQVAAIGPLSVEPKFQAHGIGRLLMSGLIAHVSMRKFNDIRLLADSHNVGAIALYTSLGFVVRDFVALIHTSPSPVRDPTVRKMMPSDLPAINQLSKNHYKTSRYNEMVNSAQYGFTIYIRERDGRPTGYLLPGLIGHSCAETTEDTIALMSEAARVVIPSFRKYLCPMSEPDLLQNSIKAGWKIEKLLTYMSLGKYEHPTSVWTPSACY